MSRNDSMLYSGITSSSPVSNKVREEAKENKREKRAQLSPVGELIKAEIKVELDKLARKDPAIVKALLASGIPNALEIDMLSDAKAADHLVAFQNRILAYLRKPSTQKLSESDDE